MIEIITMQCLRQSPLRETSSREGSLGPDRPSTLTIPSLASALPKLSRFKREAQYGSLPRVKAGSHKVPKINFQNMSVPTTPADSWGRGEGEFMHQRDLSSSVSSVEEATEAVVTPRIKSKSRLSLNLGVFDSVSLGPGSPARSPRFLPKFLRSSFSKLMQGKDRTPDPQPPIEQPMSLPFFSSVLARSRCATPEEEEVDEESPPSSPTTKTFVEESLAKGLPIIPFNYPTFVILEKKISDARAHQAASPLPGPPLFSSWGAAEKTEEGEMRSVSAPSSRKTSKRELRSTGMGQSVDDKSLSSVVSMAKQEMEEEKQEGSVRKVRLLMDFSSAGSSSIHGVKSKKTMPVQRR